MVKQKSDTHVCIAGWAGKLEEMLDFLLAQKIAALVACVQDQHG